MLPGVGPDAERGLKELLYRCLEELGATKAALPFFSDSQGITVPLDPALAGGAFGLALFLGLLASIYPALLAARMDPQEALRAL